MRLSFHAPLGATFALLMLCGCSKQPTQGIVTGTLTSDGKPLAHAMVIFVPSSGIGAAGVTLADGSYKLTSRSIDDGVRVGPCTVGIQAADPLTKPLSIPPRFRDAHTSGLSADVRAGTNRFDFDIPSK